MAIEWKALGSGNYNEVTITHDKVKLVHGSHYKGPWVKKDPFILSDVDNTIPFNNRKRAVRLMHEIYPEIPCGLYGDKSWVMPYFKPVKIKDSEIEIEVLDIYNHTGRIILDACVDGNVIKTRDGHIRCVDVDQCMRRNASDSSIRLSKIVKQTYEDVWWQEREFLKSTPQTITLLRTLVWLDRTYSWQKGQPPYSLFVMCRLSEARLKGLSPSKYLIKMAQFAEKKGPIFVSHFIEMCEVLNAQKAVLTQKQYESLLFLSKHHVLLERAVFDEIIKEKVNTNDKAKEILARSMIERMCYQLTLKSTRILSSGCKAKIQALKAAYASHNEAESLFDALHTPGTALFKAYHQKATENIIYSFFRSGKKHKARNPSPTPKASDTSVITI